MLFRLSIVVLLFIANLTLAQSETKNLKLNGAVKDVITNQSLVGVTVRIISKVNGTELNTAATDEKGFFTITGITENPVKVKFTNVGYQTQVIDSVDAEKSSGLGLISLFPTAVELPEMVIKTVKPMIEFQADKQVINMDRLPGNSGSISDALKNSGLVEIEPSTKAITVRGQNVKLKMDGHDYDMPSEMIGQMPAAMVDQVEVVLAPGAKESAEGGTYIINFITKKNTFSNFSGMVTLSTSSNKNSYGGTYFNYKVDKLNLFGQAYGNYFNGRGVNESERYVYTSPSMYYQKSRGDFDNKYYGGYFKFGFDYDFDEMNSVTFYTNYNGFKYNSNNLSSNLVNNSNNVFQYGYDRDGENNGWNNNLSFYSFYKRKFDKKGHELILDAMLTLYTNPTDSKMNLAYSNKINTPQLQNGNTDVTAKTLILKTDYTLPIDKSRIETGYGFTFRSRDNDYNVTDYSYRYQDWRDSLGLSNFFKYKEVINALYFTFANKFGDFDAKFGLRAENLATEGNQITQNITFHENYLSFFPNLNLSYKLSDMLQLGFNAFRRVTYPQIYYVNPFRQYISPNNYSAGNPHLKPNYTNSYSLNLSQYLSVFYTYTTGNFTYAMTTEKDSILLSSYINLNTQDTYGFSVTLPYYNTPMMPFHLPDFISSFYVSLNYRYSKQTGSFQTEDLSLTDKTYTLNSYIGFSLGAGYEANVSLYYLPKTENKRTVRSEMKFLSFYLSKAFMENKLRAYLFINDILNTQKSTNESIGVNFYSKNYYESKDSRAIGIGISYTFNDYKDRRDRNIDDGRDAGNRGF